MKNTWNTVKIYFQELTEVITIILMIIVGFCINDHSNDEETGNYTRVVDSCQTNCTFAVENEMQLVPTNSTVLKKTPTIEKLNNISEYIRRCRDEIKKCEDEDIVRLIHLRQKLKSLTKCIKEIKSSNLKVKELQSYNIDQIRITLKKIDNKLKNHNPTQTKLTGVTRISPESTELNQVKSSNSQLDNTESHPSINYFNDASKDIYREDESMYLLILKQLN
ncbi:uncharacterized protein LOC126265405 [Aethina tumida]|uniref:uncharacterized protein LOC126265405 n=1 Tax=Aethina tumida TaxID=116153 RepID=UPI0021496433|nr:uncharacterized protein LOC126265405 [Aethina tumida]